MNNFSTRYICDILADMRECVKTLNFSYLSGLIEELQCRANRIEDSLSIYKNIDIFYPEKIIELKNEIRELRRERDKLDIEIKSVKLQKEESNEV